MIENDQQLQGACEAMGHLHRALASLRRTILPDNPGQFTIFAEGTGDEIRRLRGEINSYLGLTANTEPAAPPEGHSSPLFAIESDEQLQGTHEALGHLYLALASLRRHILPVNPRQYALFAQGPLDEILKLQAEIDAYLELTEPAGAMQNAATVRENPPPYGQPGNP